MTILNIGPHRLKLGDVKDGLDDLMAGDKAGIVYSDPPWGSGNIKYWCTMNKKQTGRVVEPLPHPEFLDIIFRICMRYASRFVLLEYGVRWKDEFQEQAMSYGLHPIDVMEVKYKSGSRFLPNHLHLFSVTGERVNRDQYSRISGTHGFSCVNTAIKCFSRITGPTIVLDPCCGTGMTGRACVKNGLTFRGNELNAARLDKAVHGLSRKV